MHWTIQSLAINPATPSIAVGTNQQFSLIRTFSDGVTTVDLTASARWQTSNYQDAAINRQGIATVWHSIVVEWVSGSAGEACVEPVCADETRNRAQAFVAG